MVQEFVVLRCYSCQTFQVHQIKKVPKWICKVCGEKQSRKKVYGQGKASDCRKHVQKLNMMRGHIETDRHTAEEDSDSDDDTNYTLSLSGAVGVEDLVCGKQDMVISKECFGSPKSKWSKFMTTKSSDSENLEGNEPGGIQVTTERVQFDKAACKRKRRDQRDDNKNNPAKAWNSAGKGLKRQFIKSQHRDDTDTDANKNNNLMDKVCERGKDEDSHSEPGEGQETSLKLPRPGNATTSGSPMDESLFRHSKWSKFLASSSDENTQPNIGSDVFIASGSDASSPECTSHNFSISSHSLSGRTIGTYSCYSNTKETLTSVTPVRSAKFASVFSIDDELEEDWWDN